MIIRIPQNECCKSKHAEIPSLGIVTGCTIRLQLLLNSLKYCEKIKRKFMKKLECREVPRKVTFDASDRRVMATTLGSGFFVSRHAIKTRNMEMLIEIRIPGSNLM
jgi:hypothetical protein